MNRLCIFAHWDRDQIIDDYVIYYLESLRKVCTKIIFVSDCNLPPEEKSKIEGIADCLICEHHGEYDFGSYKRGFLYAKNTELNFDEIIFANDSCYGPFYPLDRVLRKTENKKCDWWGLTANTYGLKKCGDKYVSCYDKHIQSYFFALRPQVFKNPEFVNFITSVKPLKTKDEIILNYEIGLTKLLDRMGFKKYICINCYTHTENCTAKKWDKLIIKKNYPFLKTSIPKNGLWVEGEVNWESVITKYCDYPVELIKRNAQRLRNMQENLLETMNPYRKIRYKILKNLPMEARFIVIFLEKNIFNLLNAICLNKLKKF